MKQRTKKILSFMLTVMMILPLIPAFSVQAASFTLPDLISDNMLIQRDMPIKLWGYGGNPGETITVEFEDYNGNKVNEGSTIIGESGFNIELPKMEAGGPYKIFFLDEAGKRLAQVYNVLVGDLWFQGGQSNMQFTINSIPKSVEERVNPNPKDDTIRLFYNGEHFSSDTPATDLKGEWVIADKNLLEYSAVGYKALETMHNALDIPVGGICSPYGGTTLSNFNSEDAGIYKAKVAPVTQFNIKGVMWYQGGTDCKYGRTAEEIEKGYSQLVSLLRDKWNNPKLPFMVVQLHQSKMRGLKYGSETEYSITDHSPARIAQSNLYMSDENVGMAVAMDLSLQKYKDAGEDPDHPWIKAPVGERLGNATLEMVYGKDIKSKSPVYTGYSIDGNSIKITVQDAYDGLKTSDGKAPWGFRIAGADGVYYEAKATLSGNTITLTSDKVSNPVSASYGVEKHIWPYNDLFGEEDIKNAPELPEFLVNVVNSEGLPLGAFSTKDSIAEGASSPSTDAPSADTPSSSVAGSVVETGDKTVYYVATDGSNNNPGTFEKPFATIEGARDKIRKDKAAGTLKSGGAVVYIRGGEYVIEKGIVFNKEDSGTEDAPIIYRNYMDEEVNFVGGRSLNWDDFVKVTDEAVLNRIVDKAARNKVLEIDLFDAGFTDLPAIPWPGSYSYWSTVLAVVPGLKQPAAGAPELIINGKGMTVARYPNDSELQISAVYEPGSTAVDNPQCAVIGFEDNRIDNWTQADEIILYGTPQYSWGTLATTVGKIEPDKNRVHTKYPIHHIPQVDQYMYFFNLLEEIDMPGEYFVDRKAGKLYIYPPAEEVESVIYTTLEDHMLTVDGASYLTFKNINLKYMRAGAIRFINNTTNCNLIGSEITYTSKYTGYVYGYNNKVLDCYVHDVEGPIELIGGNRETLEKGENLIENCKFERTNRLTSSYMPAITLTNVGNMARYNDISDSVHTVFQMSGNLQLAEFNEIYNACTNTDDMGAIYTGRNITHLGNTFRYNYIHDIGGANRGGNGVHGMFFDDWWSAADVVGNVFANITGAGIMLAGSYNVMDNNMFINCGESMRLTRSFDYGSGTTNYATYTDGVKPYMTEGVWAETFPEMKNAIDENGAPNMNNYIVATNNVLFNTPEPRTSEEVAKTATVENNVVFNSDPGFYDLEKGNYLLKEDSEVYEKIEGFCPIPFTRMGNYTDRALNRVKNAYVYCADSPFMIENGSRVQKDSVNAIIKNETVYIPVRLGAEAVKAEVEYDEATEKVSVSTSISSLEFIDGAKDKVSVNGMEYTLSKPIVNINNTNYISVEDLAKIFDRFVVLNNGIAVMSGRDELFTSEADAELLRYIEEILTVY